MNKIGKIGIIGLGVVGDAIFKFYVRHMPKLWLYDKYKKVGALETVAEHSRIIYVAVPTPFNEHTGYDTRELTDVLKRLNDFMRKERKSCVVLIKSTLLPGMCDDFSRRYIYLNIIYNPEFLSNSTAIEDFCNPRQIILGKTVTCSNVVYRSVVRYHKIFWSDTIITETNAVNAECVKLFCNNFYSVKIQFCNELWYLLKSLQINENINCNYKKIMDMMIKNEWINPMHTSVPGSDGQLSYGGKCFPKDTKALLYLMKKYSPYYSVLENVVKERDNIRG